MTSNTASAFRKVVNAGEFWVEKDRLNGSHVLNTSTNPAGATIKAALENIVGTGVVLTAHKLKTATGEVTVSAATAPGAGGGQVLTTDVGGTTASWQTPSAGATTLATLTDCTISGTAEQDLLSWNNATSRWNNRTVANALIGSGTTSILIGHPTSYAAGASSVTIGTSAGSSATGANCIAIGTDALDGTVTAVTDVIAIGRNAAGGAITQNNTIAIGYNSLAALTTGTGNVHVGDDSGSTVATTIGSRNTFVGSSVSSVGIASDNTLVGNGAAAYASQDTSIGSGANCNTGSNCVSVGYQAYCSVANSSTAIGAQAGVYFGHNSVAVGTLAYQTGGSGVSIGHSSAGNTSCVIVGYSAGSASLGVSNVGIGQDVLDGATGVVGCVAIGTNALTAALTAGANYSVGIGYGSLAALTSGAANTAVGYNSGDTLTTGGNNTIVGYDADVDAVGRAGCTIIGKGAVSTADNQFVVATNNGANTLKSTLAIDGGAYATVASHLPVIIGGVTYYIKLYQT